jgi:hypothetical protein
MRSSRMACWICGPYKFHSDDAGEHWHAISRDLPPVAAVRFVPGDGRPGGRQH